MMPLVIRYPPSGLVAEYSQDGCPACEQACSEFGLRILGLKLYDPVASGVMLTFDILVVTLTIASILREIILSMNLFSSLNARNLGPAPTVGRCRIRRFNVAPTVALI
jgi:hypothetical protein